MSFFDCLADAVDEGSADRERAARAQQMWKDTSDRYERQGWSRENAEAMAGEDVKDAFRKEAGENRHVFQARIANMRKLQQGVASAPDLAKHQTATVESLDYKSRSLVRRFNSRLSAFLKEHHRDIAGRLTKPAQMKNIVRELHGEATGDEAAGALAKGIREALEDMRLMFNEAGGIIGQLDNYGLPHSHSRRAVTKAGFDQWFQDIAPNLKWSQIEDHMTGKPFQPEGAPPPSMETQQRFLREIYDNLKFGKESQAAIYGRPTGSALYKRRAESRSLHFNSADQWIDYNKKYGSGDPFKSLMGHVHKMSRDIVAMREFGPNPGMGIEYQEQLAMKRARQEGLDADKVAGNGKFARRMFRVESGGGQAETLWQDYVSTFLSSTRHVLTSAFLDRAIIASLSDTNTVRLAAQQMGMNPGNVLSRHVKMMSDSMTKDDALRAGWVADTLADPGIALARFQSEVPPGEIAERLSSASMRIQGLSGWTDAGRIAFQMEMAGLMAANAGRTLSDVDAPLQKALRDVGVTDDDWAQFTRAEHMFTAGNGATFASPIYWREATDLPYDQAEDIFFKIQGMIEEQTEFAVPTQSLLARGMVDPSAYDIPPGTLPYEIVKSGLMFKSFAMTFTVNQWRRTMAQPSLAGKIGYAANLVGGATALGAVSLQLAEIIKGNDPQDMTDGMFWARAGLKGGGFAVVGDIVSAGQSSWGGGFGSYVAGPMPQVAQDAWNLTIKNAWQFAMGADTNLPKELSTAIKRYTPMAQTPAIGPAFDRLVADQLHSFLDPDAERDFRKKATAQKNAYSNGSWWMPGSPLPDRAPNLMNALGR
ncbi:hypothetical protein [Sulfitobacter pontiacus]|jgi:hypothetical protein|uniref:hypothetical protein n=1 Tax=Sulfitobacter pontiacus TaxID=60137 RepID=UPI00242027CF|nr:hypothetical protein [Sulfitobacter pontiacus]|tara:strand:- start:3569 stop:6031 length:2463 start_codon:yes stop_codon:yes gene_type:complete